MTAPRYLVWYWSNPGGGRRYAYLLARRMAQVFGADRVTLSARADDPYAAIAEAEGVQVLRAALVADRKRPLATGASLLRGAALLEQHIQTAKADFVLVAMNFSLAAPLAALCSKPIVYFAHDPKPHPGDYLPVMQRLTQAALLARARRVVGLSNFAADELARLTDRKKVLVLPLGAVMAPAATARPAAQARLRLLFVGRLLPYKGLALLAEALHTIQARQDWRLTLAGSGGEETFAARAFEKFTQVTVSPGWVSDAGMVRLHADHDVLLAPYLSATQSGTVAESLALAAPVVATPAGALPEQIGKGGWIAERIDPQAFSRALIRALDEKETFSAASMAALNQARALWNFDWEGFEQKLIRQV